MDASRRELPRGYRAWRTAGLVLLLVAALAAVPAAGGSARGGEGVAPAPPGPPPAGADAAEGGTKGFTGGDNIGDIELTPEARKAIRRGLAFLVSRQNIDGSWDTEYRRNTGVVSVALLAFLASGNPPGRGEYGVASAKGLNWLLTQCQPSGMIVCQSSHGPMYEHALATLYLAEVWGQTANPQVKDKLKRAINVIVHAQNKDGGWKYQPIPAGADISVTVMQVMALRAAHDAGIAVPKKTIDKAIEYIRRNRNEDGGYNYSGPPGPSNMPRTAAGVCSLQFAGEYSAREVRDGLEYLLKNQKGDTGHFWYTQYYGVHAFYFAGGEYWKKWYPEARTQILAKLERYGDGSHDGRILDTGWAVMCLSLPHRFLPVYQR